MTVVYSGGLKKILYIHLKLSLLTYLLITTQRPAIHKDNYGVTEKYFSFLKNS